MAKTQQAQTNKQADTNKFSQTVIRQTSGLNMELLCSAELQFKAAIKDVKKCAASENSPAALFLLFFY